MEEGKGAKLPTISYQQTVVSSQQQRYDSDELPEDGPEQTKEVETMTEKLLRCGGDIRTLLVNQPRSTFLSTTNDDERKRAEPMVAGKQDMSK